MSPEMVGLGTLLYSIFLAALSIFAEYKLHIVEKILLKLKK